MVHTKRGEGGHRHAPRCTTPGCTFADFHAGAHSCELVKVRKKRGAVRVFPHGQTEKQYTQKHTQEHTQKHKQEHKQHKQEHKQQKQEQLRAHNDFQIGREACRAAMVWQEGVRLRVPLLAFAGWWDAPAVCTGRLLGPCHEGKFVAEALFDGDVAPTRLTASCLMRVDTHAAWRKPALDPVRFHVNKCAAHAKHANALARATAMMRLLLDVAGGTLEGTVVVTLDGMGTNRVGFGAALEDVAPRKRPEILTFEMDPEVACAQRVALGFGADVRYTGGDPELACKGLFAGGSTPKLEHLLTTSNRLVSEETQRKIVFLNLDYCGGPPKNHHGASATFMERVFAHLPALRMIAVTIARRNHADLDATFDTYVPPPFGFRLRQTFADNKRVLCKVYVRDVTITRHLSVPGAWWSHVSPDVKRRTFDGTVVGRDKDAATFRVYVPYDDQEYKMRADAVRAYAA